MSSGISKSCPTPKHKRWHLLTYCLLVVKNETENNTIQHQSCCTYWPGLYIKAYGFHWGPLTCLQVIKDKSCPYENLCDNCSTCCPTALRYCPRRRNKSTSLDFICIYTLTIWTQHVEKLLALCWSKLSNCAFHPKTFRNPFCRN